MPRPNRSGESNGEAATNILDRDFPTPFVYVDENRLEANIALMAERCRSAGVALRPHVKTHKTAAIARLKGSGVHQRST